MTRRIALLALLGLLSTPVTASAQFSGFATGSEGWSTGDLFSSASPIAANWVATGGNPGGFLRTTDQFSWNAYLAPSVFLGNKSAFYGGALSFDMQLLTTDPGSVPAVVISDGTTRLQAMSLPPGTSWTSFLFPLTEATWQVSNGSGNAGPVATQAQFQAVLANLTSVRVNGDWRSGPDQVDLDNFSMTAAVVATPEPASLALLGTGLLGITFFARRRRA